MKKALNFILSIVLPIPFWIARRIRRRAWFLTGTFIGTDGDRKFFRTCFIAYNAKLPLRSIEKATAKQFGVPSVVIFSVVRVSVATALSIESENGYWEVLIDEKTETK